MAELTLTNASVGIDLRRVSPGAHLADLFGAAEVSGPRAVGLRELPFLTMLGLRAAPGSTAAERLSSQLRVRLPTSCGDVATQVDSTVLWLAPDEFLVVSSEPATDLSSRLVAALHGAPGSVVDLSASRTTFELTGPSARDVLEKGCPLDLHPRSFAVGSAYLTTVGAVAVVLWKTGEQTYRLLPRSSFADFLGRWLVDAMTEYQSPELHS